MRNHWKRGVRLGRPRRAPCSSSAPAAMGDRSTSETKANEEKAAESGDCGEVNMAVNPWVGYEADAYVFGAVAEQELGCKVNYKDLKEDVSWQGFGTGEVDVVIEDWGHPDLEKKFFAEEGDGSATDVGLPRQRSASSAGTCRRGWPRSTRTSSTARTSTSTPTGLRDLGVRRQGPVPRRRPVLRAVRRGDRQQPRPGLPGRLLRQRGRQHLGVPEGGGEQGVPDRLLLRAAVALRRDPPRAGGAAAVHRRLPGRPGRRSPATTRRPTLKKSSRPSGLEEGGAGGGPGQELEWTNDDQNVVAKYIAEDGMSAEDAAAKWIDDNPDKVDAWLSS